MIVNAFAMSWDRRQRHVSVGHFSVWLRYCGDDNKLSVLESAAEGLLVMRVVAGQLQYIPAVYARRVSGIYVDLVEEPVGVDTDEMQDFCPLG